MTADAMAAGAIVFVVLETGGDRRCRKRNVRCEIRTWKSRHRNGWHRQGATGDEGGNAYPKDQIRPKSGRHQGRQTHESYQNGAGQNQGATGKDEGPNPPWCTLDQGRREREAKMERPDGVFMLGWRESRHIRSYEDNEDSQQSLDLDPPGIAQNGGIAWLHLQRWQKPALKTVGNEQNAAEEGELHDQQVSIDSSDSARDIADQIPGQYASSC